MLDSRPFLPHRLLKDMDFIAQEDFGGTPLPASVASRGDHERASRVEVELRDDTSSVARHNRVRNSRMFRAILLFEIIQA